jgi:hypothetical protein
LAWVLLAIVPFSGTTQVNGGPYFWTIIACGAVIGLSLDGHPLGVGALLAAPALVAAPWTVPRGDGDGLWILWFGAIVAAGGGAALAHLTAVGARRRYRARRERF